MDLAGHRRRRLPPLPELAEQAFASAAIEVGVEVDAGELAGKLTKLPLYPDAIPALDALGPRAFGVDAGEIFLVSDNDWDAAGGRSRPCSASRPTRWWRTSRVSRLW